MKKQTAVEWLIRDVNENIAPLYIPKQVIEQALDMEKEQIIQANLEGQFHADGIKANTVAEQYYNETFNK